MVDSVADLRSSLARHNRYIKMRLKCGRLSLYLALARSLSSHLPSVSPLSLAKRKVNIVDFSISGENVLGSSPAA